MIAVTAMEVATALGSLAQTRTAVGDGASALAPLDDLGVTGWRGARLPGTQATEGDPALRVLGRHGRALEPVLHAVHEAAGFADVARERVGLFLALGMVDAEVQDLAPAVRASRARDGAFDLSRFFHRGFRSIHPLWPLSMLNNVAAGQLAIDLDIRGDNVVLASDAVAGIRAIAEATRALQAGACDVALVAGAAETVGIFGLARWRHEGHREDFTPGEGAGAWALCHTDRLPGSAAHAQAYVRGAATSFGRAAHGPGPDVPAVMRAIRTASTHADLDLPADSLARVKGVAEVLGHLGPATPFVEAAVSLPVAGDHAQHRVLVGRSASGGAGAVILEVPCAS